MEDNIKQNGQRERLESLVISLKITLRDLARMVGLNENTLYHVNPGSKNRLSERTASRICYFIEKEKGVRINREWLLNGEGSMYDEEYFVDGAYSGEPSDVSDMNGECATSASEWKKKYMCLLEQHLELQRKYMEFIENKNQ